MTDTGGDGWDGITYTITTDGAFRFNGTLTDGYNGVRYFCMEDGVHTITLAGTSDTESEVCFEFDDVAGDNFRGCSPIVDIFHTDVGHLYGAPSPAPTTSHPPTEMPTPYPTTVPSPFPSEMPLPAPSAVPLPAPTFSPTTTSPTSTRRCA